MMREPLQPFLIHCLYIHCPNSTALSLTLSLWKMGDFSFLSDTDDDRAVEELISQAQELSVLEQVAAINCSGFTDSVLPTEVESRFRKLKSFPVTKSKPNASLSSSSSNLGTTHQKFNLNKLKKQSEKSNTESDSSLSDEENTISSRSQLNSNEKKYLKKKLRSRIASSPLSSSKSSMENVYFSSSKQNHGEKRGLKSKSKSGYASSLSDSSDSSMEKAVFSYSKQNSDGKRGLKSKSRHGTFHPPSVSSSMSIKSSKQNSGQKKDLKSKSKSGHASSSSNFSDSSLENGVFSSSKQNSDAKGGLKPKSRHGSFQSPSVSSKMSIKSPSPSPPLKTGCFWCSPKSSRKKINENRSVRISFDWGKNDEILSESGILSVKKQERILKKAMKEEEKITREAEKIVKWAKQTSARINVSDIEDELSDDDRFK